LLGLSPQASAQISTKSWQEAIASVEQFRAEVESRLGRWENPGTSMNEVDVPQHRCSILGRTLEKSEVIKDIEVDYSNIGTSDYDISIALTSLDNWLSVARYLVGYAKDYKVKMWNLNCVGQMGIPTSAYIASEGPATFYEVENDGAVLRVLGDVERGFSDKLQAALLNNPSVKYVGLGSGGGYVHEAIKAGLIIRKYRLDTVLWDDCYSACTLVFLGGVERTIWSPYPRLGFHKVSIGGNAVDLYDESYNLIGEYTRAMGVDVQAVLKAMIKAEPSGMNYPDHEYLCNGRITTWIQRSFYCK